MILASKAPRASCLHHTSARTGVRPLLSHCIFVIVGSSIGNDTGRQLFMESETLNKAIVGRWFASFWGVSCDLAIVDEWNAAISALI
jgi:hypothetical protein